MSAAGWAVVVVTPAQAGIQVRFAMRVGSNLGPGLSRGDTYLDAS